MSVKKKTFILIIIISLLGIHHFCGCVEKEDSVEKKYDIIIDDDFTNQTKGFNIDHFKNISSGIAASSDNMLIYVKNGVYNETISIDKILILEGENANKTILDGGYAADDVIHVEGNGQIKLSGFTIRNGGNKSKHGVEVAGIDLRSNGNRITGNIITNNIYGIYGLYSDNNIIEKNLFYRNIEYGCYTYLSCDDNNFSNNVFDNNQYPLRIKGSLRCQVFFNIFVNNTKGLYICCGAKYTIMYGNIFCNNSEWDGYDSGDNRWDLGSIPDSWNHHINVDKKIDNNLIGNFWDSYYLEEQGAYDHDKDGIIDESYDIPNVEYDDNHPLAQPPLIDNSFFNIDYIREFCFS